MKRSMGSSVLSAALLLLGSSFGTPAAKAAISLPDALLYIPLTDSCRVVDTRVAGSVGLLSAAGGNYTFGARDADIETAYQSGNPLGCAIPDEAVAISVYFNMTNASLSGNIFMWTTASSTRPTGGSGVYNPSVSGQPQDGDVLYNPGHATLQINPVDGRFYVAVANGDLDITINAQGYWLPVSSYFAANGSGANHTANASVIAPTTIAGGLVGLSAVMPISGSAVTTLPQVSIVGSTLNLNAVMPATQIFPQAATFTTAHGAFYTTAGLSLVGTNLTPKAQLYVAPAGSFTATATSLVCTGTPFTGVVAIGTATPCTATGSATVNEGDIGIWVISVSATGLSLVNTFVGGALMTLSP